jgi:type II secretory pathway component PulJ
MSFIFSGIRKEMKERTDELLEKQDSLLKALNRNTKILKKILESGVSKELKDELNDSMKKLIEVEEQLDSSVHEHISVLKKIMEQIG